MKMPFLFASNVNGKIKMYKYAHKNGILLLEFELGKGGEGYRR